MHLNPYLYFNGQCEAAFRFYEECLGGKIALMMTYEGSPMADQAPPGWGKKILHGTLNVGDIVLQGADSPQQKEPGGFSLSLTMDKPVDADRIFHTLAETGKVQLPIQETFWALRFGMVVDRFGVPWMINCEKSQ